MVSASERYSDEAFRQAAEGCDLVMKGGVTSGLVYPYAILELARRFRFHSIGGTSAGGIAAAFAAAAEFGRTVRGDPAAFWRLKSYCDELPTRLSSLFQPTPKFKGLMRYILRAQRSKGVSGWLIWLPTTFWLTALAGGLIGAVLLFALQSGLAGVILGGLIGLLIALAIRILNLLEALPSQGFGMCPGLTQPGDESPGLTDWLNAAIQDIAFGDPAYPKPLTFGDLESDPGHRINLRMVTTNLSMRRPHVLPKLELEAGITVKEWTRLFPASVIQHLVARTKPHRRIPETISFPASDDLPVLVAVRMSLSFPLLFSAIPLEVRDVDSSLLARRTGGGWHGRGAARLANGWGTEQQLPHTSIRCPAARSPNFRNEP